MLIKYLRRVSSFQNQIMNNAQFLDMRKEKEINSFCQVHIYTEIMLNLDFEIFGMADATTMYNVNFLC